METQMWAHGLDRGSVCIAALVALLCVSAPTNAGDAALHTRGSDGEAAGSGTAVQIVAEPTRPSYEALSAGYPEGKTAQEVFAQVGGRVAYNGLHIDERYRWYNDCAVKVSISLNASGFPIPQVAGKTSSGADGKWHFFRVRDLEKHLTSEWGRPDRVGRSRADLRGAKGVLIIDTGSAYSDATGHSTLWDGADTIDYSERYFRVSERLLLWELQ